MNDEHPRDDAADGGSSSTGSATVLSAVGALMEERRQFETWLAALEAKRAETPKHVFTRVHADYTARLESVMTRLITHADGLRAELTSLTTRLATLDEQQHRARDERAEAELRAHVGELSSEAWKDLVSASDATLTALAAQHASAADDLRRTRELLTDAERPPTPVPAAAPVPAPAPVSDVAAASLHVPGASGAPAPVQSRQPTVGASSRVSAPEKKAESSAPSPNGLFDELAFLQSVVDTSATGEPKAAAPESAPPTSAPASASAPVPAISAPPVARREPFAPRKPDPRPEDRIVKQGEAAAPLIQPNQGRTLAGNISGNNPIVLKDKSTESAKTLKCAECGAMNYPTEWYCERCGAELASL